MRLHPPLPACDLLPTITLLPPFEHIHSDLMQVIDEAYKIPRTWRLRDEVRPLT